MIKHTWLNYLLSTQSSLSAVSAPFTVYGQRWEKKTVICSVTWLPGYDVTLNEENSPLENLDRLFLKFGAFTILLWFIDQQIATAPGQAAHFKDRLLTGPHKQKEITLDCRYMGRLRRFIWGRDGQSSRTR